ncbi:MAG: DJ-1/PfpI family protein [Burkholderiales bacterium]|nr:DJ-1/PfpI family protein [Burkholderiales bacterium]
MKPPRCKLLAMFCLTLLCSIGALADIPAKPPRTQVAILLFDGVDVIDYAGPFEVFLNAEMDIYTVSANGAAITTEGGMKVQPTYSYANAPDADVVLIPGGNVRSIKNDAATLAWIKQHNAHHGYLMSVCNGAFTLANTGLLSGLKATTTSGNIDALRKAHADIEVLRDARVVDNDRILTTGGLSAGIDGALHMVERLQGKGQAQFIAEILEYHWQPEGSFLPGIDAFHVMHQLLGEENLTGYGHIETLVSTSGDKNGWRYVWRVRSALGHAELANRIDTALADERKQMGMQAPYDASPNHQWRFTDSDQQAWNEQLDVADVAGESDTHLVTLSVTHLPQG